MARRMGIYEFKMLSKSEQYDTVFTRGQFVDTVSAGDMKYVLYSLSYFWVEVEYYSPENKIVKVACFVDGKRLDRYSNLPDKI